MHKQHIHFLTKDYRELAFSIVISISRHSVTCAAGNTKATRFELWEARLKRVNRARQWIYIMPHTGTDASLRNFSFTTVSFTSIPFRRSVGKQGSRKRKKGRERENSIDKKKMEKGETLQGEGDIRSKRWGGDSDGKTTGINPE